MTIKEFFSFRENKFFWVHIITMIVTVCLLIFLVLKGLDIYTQHGKSVVVPNVQGMTENEAGMLLRNHGFECQVVDSNYVKTALPGSILDQNPAAGLKVKSGRIIYLTINSLSTPTKIVPDVADNSSLRQAQAKLMAAGFKLSMEEYIPGEKDWVYGVKYNGRELRPGEKVPTGTLLTILVGNGEKQLSIDQDSLNMEDSFSESANPAPSENSTAEESWF